jgi:hypothetical protein
MTLDEESIQAIVSLVRRFTDFTADNDPYGEHDFGAVEYQGSKYFWKFDYYDKNVEFGSPDPSDTSQTTRVLTIFASDDY